MPARRLRAAIGPLGGPRLASGLICLLAGLMIMVSALNARGTDLRPDRNTDLVGLVQAQSRRNAQLSRDVTALRAEIDALSVGGPDQSTLNDEVQRATSRAGLTAVTGPAVSVTLDDAPSDVAANGVDEDLLVVHQQDIQAVVNALWSGGAEAMTIADQRVISTTGIKCVGNTVVLHGIPYAPPYVITAIGDPARLHAALRDSTAVQIYRQYVDAFGLGYRERDLTANLPSYLGGTDLQYATTLGDNGAPASGTPGSTATPR